MAPTKLKRKLRLFCDNLEEFTDSTTLHGFRYLCNKRRYSVIERLWWLLMVVLSILACGYFINKIWNKWNGTPVILKLSDVSTSIWDIPFPAVTICSETKVRHEIFNYTKAHRERWSVPATISKEDLKMFYDLLLVCNKESNDGPDYVDKTSIETLRKVAPTLKEIFLYCSWTNFTCDQMFYQSITTDGFCFTFNMMSSEEIFRTENLHKDYYHVSGLNKSHWSPDGGYADDAGIFTYPLRAASYEDVDFKIFLTTDMLDLDVMCRGSTQGFKVWIHNPAELPNMGQNYFTLPIKHQIIATITPRLTSTASGLRSYTSSKRRCYFSDEYYLSFFRKYTEYNCNLECIANYTAKRCGCVPMFMPHGPDTKLCGTRKTNCVIKAHEEMSLTKATLGGHLNVDNGCGCLQACTELNYEVYLTQAVYHPSIYKSNPNPEIASGRYLPSGLVMYFASGGFTAVIREELYGTVEFLANCGGIMSFFIGFSVLSLVEIIYHFTIRLWCRMRKSTIITVK